MKMVSTTQTCGSIPLRIEEELDPVDITKADEEICTSDLHRKIRSMLTVGGNLPHQKADA